MEGMGWHCLVQQSLCRLGCLALDHKSIDYWGGIEMGRGRVVLSVTAIFLFFDHLALDHKTLNSWGRRIGRGGLALSGTAIFDILIVLL